MTVLANFGLIERQSSSPNLAFNGHQVPTPSSRTRTRRRRHYLDFAGWSACLFSAFDLIRDPHPFVGNLQIGKRHAGRGSGSEGASLPCHRSATTRPLLRGETFPLFSFEAVFHPLNASDFQSSGG